MKKASGGAEISRPTLSVFPGTAKKGVKKDELKVEAGESSSVSESKDGKD